MTSVLAIRNRQRRRGISVAALRAATRCLLEDLLQQRAYHLCLHLVGPVTMAGLNARFLGHEGPTDVITFDQREGAGDPLVWGEVFICVEVAVRQAQDFGTTWQEEVLRYVVHGVLHLLGYDDLQPAARRRMKRVENRLVKTLVTRRCLTALEQVS